MNNTKKRVSLVLIPILITVNIIFCQNPASDSLIVATQINQLTVSLLKQFESQDLAVAVLPFETTEGRSAARGLGEAAAVLINQVLVNRENTVVVERQKLQEIMEEIGLSQSGLTQDEIKVGQLLNVNYLVAGAVADLGSRFLLAARIVEVQTGNIVASASIELPAQNFLSITSGLVPFKRYPATAAFRSMLVPGWGQFYNEQPKKGSILLGTEFAIAVTAVTSYLLYKQSKDAYDRTTQRDIAAKKYDEMEQYAQMNWVSLGILGTVWLYSVVDSYFESRKQIKEYQQ